MIRSLSTILVACLAVTLAVNTTGSPADPIVITTQSATASDLFDLDFPGGTLKEYVEAIRKKVRNANIIIMPDAMNIPMPAVRLTSVELGGALNFLDDRFMKANSQFFEIRLSFHKGNRDLGELDIYTINAIGHSSPVSTMVFSVSDILQGDVSVRDLLSTIESSLELVSENIRDAQVQFHPETSILIVCGYEAQVELVSNLLEELNQAAARKQQLMALSTAAKNRQENDDVRRQQQETIQRWESRYRQFEQDTKQLRLELLKCNSKKRALEQEVMDLKKAKGIE